MNFLLSFLMMFFTPEDSNPPCVCKMQNTFPVPPAQEQTLFYLQRTHNHNTIMFDLNVESGGTINSKEPVHPYWIRYSDDGRRQELSYIQSHYAYGLKSKKLPDGRFELRFVSYKKVPLYLYKSPRENRYRVQTTINGKTIEVTRVFLQIEGGSFWLPNVVCAEIKGVDPQTGQEIVELFKP